MKKLQLAKAIESDAKERAQEHGMNQDSISHSEYDVHDSRKNAFQ